MASRETVGFDPCVFHKENSCLLFLAMKTHAIFTLEMNERSGLSPASRTLHSSTVADSPAAASSERAREPIPALASRRLWANVAELDEARRENAPHTAKNWKRKGLRRVGKFQTFRAAFAHRSLEPIISLCEASDSYIRMFILPRGNRFVTCLPDKYTDSIHAFSPKKTRASLSWR